MPGEVMSNRLSDVTMPDGALNRVTGVASDGEHAAAPSFPAEIEEIAHGPLREGVAVRTR